MTRITLCTLANVPSDRPLRVQLPDGKGVCVYKVNSGVAVSKDICPHKGAKLDKFGELDGESVTCLWHDCKFDLRTGIALDGPCPDPLEIHECEVDGDTVYLMPKD